MNKRETILKELVDASIAKGYCEHCWEPTEDWQFTLCTKHYKKYRKTWAYKYLCSIHSSAKYREIHWIWDVFLNKIKCLKCNTTAESKNWHDMKWCECWACAADWGSWYLRRVGNREDYKDYSKPFINI